MLRRSSRSRNFFKKLVVNGVNNSKAAIQNDCLMRLYDADAELKAISSELDSFDGKKDPIRCNLLVNQLRTAQDKVISLLFELMDDCNCERAPRDYRMKFPDEILLSEGSESLNGQIWFGAECLSAGSNILNHTKESTMLRPMAKTLTQHLDSLRNDLRDLVIDGGGASRINQALIKKMVAFDHIFATFEYEYVRTMLPIRTVAEIEKLQEVAVLFSETLIDCVKRGLIKQDDIDEFQPIVMIAIPRLAIVRGLLYKNENPIYTRHKSQMCSLFQPFHGPLHSIRKLLRGLSPQELFTLERMLANDQSSGENGGSNKGERSTDGNKEDSMQCNDGQARDNHLCGCEHQNASQAGTSNNYSNVLMDCLRYPVGQKRDVIDSADDCRDKTPTTATNDEQQGYSCYLEVQASSSKAIVDDNVHHHLQHRNSIPDHSPASNSHAPSPSSSLSSATADCKKCIKKSDCRTSDDEAQEENVLQKNQCDNGNCCLSPPESDAQLEKLIANFSPSMSDEHYDQSTLSTTALDLVNSANTFITSSSSNANLAQDVTQSTIAQNTCELIEASATGDSKTNASENMVKRDATLTTVKSEDEAALEELFQKQAQKLLHRLFVAISGVADQLQSNFASDLRFILRHIFSSEIANDGDDDDDNDDGACDENNEIHDVDDDGEYSNNDQSDCSLPIEQGIEAQEVANLIDLESGYSLNDTYPISDNRQFIATAAAPTSSDFSYLNSSPNAPVVTDLNRYSSTSSSTYAHSANHHNQNRQTINTRISANSRAFQDTLNEEMNNELLADLMRAPDQSELIYETRSSPNEPSIMDENQHRQQLVQQHLQSVSRTVNRAHRSNSASGHHQLVGNDNQQQGFVERRHSRHHHHHHGSRSARRSRGPPVWVPDQLVVQCNRCNVPFTLFRRRHHCRACGQIFCADCSRFTKNLNCWGYNGPVRVCEGCYNQP